MKGLTVEAERAEQARATGDTATLSDAIAVGRALLERVRAAVEQAHRIGFAHDVQLRGRHAKAEVEWTRLQGRSDPARWQAAVDAFAFGHVYAVARCQWRLAEALLGAGDREPQSPRPRPPTRPPCDLPPSRCGRRWRRWPAVAASTLALAYRSIRPWPASPP